jgi:hypothetical protein
MVASSGSEAIGNARRYQSCKVGYCLQYVRTWLEIGSRDPSAIAAWSNAGGKHAGDRNAPLGAPMFYSGGRYGHIVIAGGDVNGKQIIRSTDVPGSGRVSSVDIGYCERNWNYRYLGWTETLNGVTIPFLAGGGKKAGPWEGGTVYVNRLKEGTTDSDSVRRLRSRLDEEVPKDFRPGPGGAYGDAVVKAVKWWQRNKFGAEDAKGLDMSNNQADRLFGEAYRLVREK